MLPDSKALVMPNYASESVEAVDLASLPGPRWARGGRTVPSRRRHHGNVVSPCEQAPVLPRTDQPQAI
jgi:hypothetical protein